ncbi:MAG: flavodoxin family protein [Chloroflexi bacterium]|nr:flavodoxin family protein [Chloroflexota bacterium]
MKTRILGISASQRPGNVDILVKEALKAGAALGNVETDFISLKDRIIYPCTGCYRCCYTFTDPPTCVTYDDDMNDIIARIWDFDPDGVIVGSPVHFAGVTGTMRTFIERFQPVPSQGMPMRNKVMGFISCGSQTHGGQEHAVDDLIHWALILDAIVVGVGPERSDDRDASMHGAMATASFQGKEFGDDVIAVLTSKGEMDNARLLGRRVTEAARIVKAGLEAVSEDELSWPKKGGLAAMENPRWRDKGWMESFAQKVEAERKKYGYNKLERALRLEDKKRVKAWLKRGFPE